MSKLSQLKQEAYQAAKKRNWPQAVTAYERILELDKNNPTVINELGDVCLKGGSTQAAIRHFLNAAAKYRTTGLLNNAVAIYKKILRYDAENLNAHWYLAETRASQGLSVEGENHGIHFLENSASVSGELKEIFLKRCNQLFELYPQSDPILDRLVQIFRMWKMPLEASRATCLIACRAYDAGDRDGAARMLEHAVGQTPEVQNYPEYAQWMRRTQPKGAGGGTFADFGAVSLDDGRATPAETAAAPDGGLDDVAPDTFAADDAAAETAGTGPVADADPEPAAEAFGSDAPVRDDADDQGPDQGTADDTVEFGADSADFDALIAEATSRLASPDRPADDVPAAPETDEPAGEPVDLLAEILADDSALLAGGESSQLESITREIGTQVGGDENAQDPASLYEMGTVYLEMGMHLQACESFAKATDAGDRSYALRAYEMWGMTLQRAGRFDEAVEVLRKGLALADAASKEHLGLLYNLGKAFEAADRTDEAAWAYEKIQAKDPSYLDVGRRLARLSTV